MKKVIKLLKKHTVLFKIYLWFSNNFRFKNKIRVKGCNLIIGNSRLNGLVIKNKGSGNKVIIGDNVKVNSCTININGNNNLIVLNNNCLFNQVDFYVENSGNEISVGSGTEFYGKTHLATIEGTKIIIGNNCLFSSDLHFRTGDSHSLLNMHGERINPSEDIIIEDHVWIGTKVTCLKGVRVSKNSVVAATATLCRKYDVENVVIAGVPGKIVKNNINWSKERIKPVNQKNIQR